MKAKRKPAVYTFRSSGLSKGCGTGVRCVLSLWNFCRFPIVCIRLSDYVLFPVSFHGNVQRSFLFRCDVSVVFWFIIHVPPAALCMLRHEKETTATTAGGNGVAEDASIIQSRDF